MRVGKARERSRASDAYGAAENALRVSWAGCGLTVPARLRRGSTLRHAVRTVLADPGYRLAAESIAASPWASGGARRAAVAVEALAAR